MIAAQFYGYIELQCQDTVGKMTGMIGPKEAGLAQAVVVSQPPRRALRGGVSLRHGENKANVGNADSDGELPDGYTAQGDVVATREEIGVSALREYIHQSKESVVELTLVPNLKYAKLVSRLCTKSLSTPNTIALLIKLARG